MTYWIALRLDETEPRDYTPYDGTVEVEAV